MLVPYCEWRTLLSTYDWLAFMNIRTCLASNQGFVQYPPVWSGFLLKYMQNILRDELIFHKRDPHGEYWPKLCNAILYSAEVTRFLFLTTFSSLSFNTLKVRGVWRCSWSVLSVQTVHCIFACLCTQSKIECAILKHTQRVFPFISSVVFFHSVVAATKMWRYIRHQQRLDIWPQEMKKIYVKYGAKWTIDRSHQFCLTDAEIFGKKTRLMSKSGIVCFSLVTRLVFDERESDWQQT